MHAVFVDSSGFYAHLNADDSFHEQAAVCFRQAAAEGWGLVTTNYVVHETWAIVQARLGWEAVESWRGKVLCHCAVTWVDASLHKLGAARCAQARERRLSLTDCVSLEFMHQRGITEAIAQDEHFVRAGIRLPELRIG